LKRKIKKIIIKEEYINIIIISYIESNKIFGITECKLQLKLNLNEASLVKSKQQKTDLKNTN